MQRYESYKPSGAEWLGNIPSHWTVIPAKRLFREVSEKNFREAELLSVTQEFGVIPRSQLEQRVVMPTGQLQTFKLVRTDDFVISLRSFQGGIEYSEYTGLVSPAYTVLRKQKTADSRYLKHLLKSAPFISEINTSVTGIREGKNISFAEMSYSLMPLPELDEQKRIADFLDQKTAEIDTAIAKKKRLIELLQEQKSILINQAVTRGLNPDVPMRDSGVEWIGSVPAHWGLGALSYQASIFAGGTPDRSKPRYWGGSIPWLKTGEVNFNRLSVAEEHISMAGLKNSAAKIAPENTLLMAMYGQGITRGRVAILDVPAAFNQACVGISFGRNISAEFGFFYFYGAYSFLRDSGNETSQMNLSSGAISKFKITIPPIEEQVEICTQLKIILSTVDQTVATQRVNLSKLEELKSVMIANAVTGKIKV